jgi:hypothetical protein
MAETTKNKDNAKKRVTVRLPRNPGHDARQEEFFSHNFKNYIIKRGETVEIPEELAGVIRDAEKAEEYAMRYVEGLVEAEKEKRRGNF